MWELMFPNGDEFVQEFVGICLDFSIAQYMEDRLLNIQKEEFALSDKNRKTSHIHTRVFNKLKKTIIKTIVKKAHKSPLTNGTGKE